MPTDPNPDSSAARRGHVDAWLHARAASKARAEEETARRCANDRRARREHLAQQALERAHNDCRSTRDRSLPVYSLRWARRAKVVALALAQARLLPTEPFVGGYFATLGLQALNELAAGESTQAVGFRLLAAINEIDPLVEGKEGAPCDMDGNAPRYLKSSFWWNLSLATGLGTLSLSGQGTMQEADARSDEKISEADAFKELRLLSMHRRKTKEDRKNARIHAARVIRACDRARCFEGEDFTVAFCACYYDVADIIREYGRRQFFLRLELPPGIGWNKARDLLRAAVESVPPKQWQDEFERYEVACQSIGLVDDVALMPLRDVFQYAKDVLLGPGKKSTRASLSAETVQRAHASLLGRRDNDRLTVEEVIVLYELQGVQATQFRQSTRWVSRNEAERRPHRLPIVSSGRTPAGKRKRRDAGKFASTLSWTVAEVRAALKGHAGFLGITLRGPF